MEIQQERPAKGTLRFDDWSTPLLIDFIQQHHHRYAGVHTREIMGLFERICEKHGADQLLLRKLQQTFGLLVKELLGPLCPKKKKSCSRDIAFYPGGNNAK